jgi:hypothetical protein
MFSEYAIREYDYLKILSNTMISFTPKSWYSVPINGHQKIYNQLSRN